MYVHVIFSTASSAKKMRFFKWNITLHMYAYDVDENDGGKMYSKKILHG